MPHPSDTVNRTKASEAPPPRDDRPDIERWRADLTRIADEVRVKLHLGGMDARDAWNRLEPKLRDFERKAANATKEVTTELRHSAATLREELHRLRDRLSK
jgi:hypothetical protein